MILIRRGEYKETKLYYCQKKKDYLGYVKLVDIMPNCVPEDRTADIAIVEGARISYGSTQLRKKEDDERLIRYLIQHHHTSPLEMCELKFEIKCPLFVFNQLVRHRTASLNCVSRRYTKIQKEDFYVPEIRVQSKINKQGSHEGNVSQEQIDKFNTFFENCENMYDMYDELVEENIAKELVRCGISQNIMTSFV